MLFVVWFVEMSIPSREAKIQDPQQRLNIPSTRTDMDKVSDKLCRNKDEGTLDFVKPTTT